MTLAADVTREPDGLIRIALSGAIDERADLDNVFDSVKEGRVELDLGHITRINSMGVLRWIPALEAFSKQCDVEVVRASYVVVNQANSVANFFGSARVSSCLAPYFCPNCMENMMLEVSVSEVRASAGVPPSRQCPRDQSVLEFDELDTYFTFVTS